MPTSSQKDSSDHEIETLLREYQATSGAIAENLKRIDLIRGLYATALIALAAVILKPEGTPIQDRLEGATRSQLILSVLLLLPIVNATLLIHVTSFMHFIFAAAKYNTHYLGARLAKLIGHRVLSFDRWESPAGDKGAWLFTRNVVGVANFVLITLVSMAILVEFKEAGQFAKGWIPGLLYCTGIVATALSLSVGLVYYLVSRRFGETKALMDEKPRVSRWYALTAPLSFGLYITIRLI